MADAVGGAPKTNGHTNGYPSKMAAKYNLAAHFIGGNELGSASPSKVKDFVAAHDGHTVITSVRTSAHTENGAHNAGLGTGWSSAEADSKRRS